MPRGWCFQFLLNGTGGFPQPLGKPIATKTLQFKFTSPRTGLQSRVGAATLAEHPQEPLCASASSAAQRGPQRAPRVLGADTLLCLVSAPQRGPAGAPVSPCPGVTAPGQVPGIPLQTLSCRSMPLPHSHQPREPPPPFMTRMVSLPLPATGDRASTSCHGLRMDHGGAAPGTNRDTVTNKSGFPRTRTTASGPAPRLRNCPGAQPHGGAPGHHWPPRSGRPRCRAPGSHSELRRRSPRRLTSAGNAPAPAGEPLLLLTLEGGRGQRGKRPPMKPSGVGKGSQALLGPGPGGSCPPQRQLSAPPARAPHLQRGALVGERGAEEGGHDAHDDLGDVLLQHGVRVLPVTGVVAGLRGESGPHTGPGTGGAGLPRAPPQTTVKALGQEPSQKRPGMKTRRDDDGMRAAGELAQRLTDTHTGVGPALPTSGGPDPRRQERRRPCPCLGSPLKGHRAPGLRPALPAGHGFLPHMTMRLRSAPRPHARPLQTHTPWSQPPDRQAALRHQTSHYSRAGSGSSAVVWPQEGH